MQVRSVARQLLDGITRPRLWLTLGVCAVTLAARRPDLVRNPQFWAEDGHFYFAAMTMGWKSLFDVYAGYLHTVPRLVALAAAATDPLWAPAIFVTAAAAFTLYVAARTQSDRCPLPRHAGVAFAVVLVPDGFEVLLNIVNLQWVLAGALLLLLMSADARRWTQHVHDAVAAVLFGLTGPFSVVLTPLFVARAWHRRTRTAWTLAVLVVACGVVQAEMIRRHPFPMPGDTISPVAALAVPGMRIVGSLLAGSLVPADYPRVIEHILGASTLIGVALLAARRGFGRPERTWLALAFAGLLASSLYRCRYVWPDLCHAGFGSRYFYPLQLAAIWLIIAAANDSRRWIARIATVIAVWMFAINVPRLREPAFDDKHWADYAPKIRAGEAVVVPINPSDWTISFPARPKPAIAPPH